MDLQDLRGVSGLHHPLLAVGIDDKRRRMVVISMEHDARGTALAQSDLQMAFPKVHVIVARPVFVSVSAILSPDDIINLSRSLIEERLLTHYKDTAARAETILPEDKTTNSWIKMHFAHFDDLLLETTLANGEDLGEGHIQELKAAAEEDPIAKDRELGVCGIPIYGFSAEEFSDLMETDHVDFVRETLRRKNILQYFFPPPDQLALGLVDRFRPKNRAHLIDLTKSAPAMGHPFGQPEIVQASSPQQVIDELLDRGLAVEGELTIDIGPDGQSLRSTVRFKPREGLLSKIINRISVDLSFKDLFGNRGSP